MEAYGFFNQVTRLLLILFHLRQFSACVLSAKPLVSYDGQVSFRHWYDDAAPWTIIAKCIENTTSAKAIVDRHGDEPLAGYSIWLDTGSAEKDEVDKGITDNITYCIGNKTDIAFLTTDSHNVYAIAGAYDTDEEYNQHYQFFGHGYPENYDKDYESYGDPGSDNVSVDTLYSRGNDNWPDKMLPNQQARWEYYVIGRLYNNYNYKGFRY